MTVLVTSRLTLVMLTRAEAAAIRDADREGRRWAADYPTEGDLVVASIVGEAGEAYDDDARLGPMQVVVTATGEVVGGAGFLSAPDPEGTVEIGYGLAASARGLGYASEAVEALVGHALAQGARSVMAVTAPDNLASQRVLERTGFVRAGEVTGEAGVVWWRWLRA